jgi:hypothetical protein
VFTENIWVEVDQDKNWSNAEKYEKFLTHKNTSKKDASGFHIAVSNMGVKHHATYGKGQAFLMNLSPQWYNAWRQADSIEDCKKRSVFMNPVKKSGVRRWVKVSNVNQKSFGYEIAYWSKGGRTILFVLTNPDSSKTSLGGGNSKGLKVGKTPITLSLAKTIRNVKNERTGKALKDGKTFQLTWNQPEALVLSFDGHPYR